MLGLRLMTWWSFLHPPESGQTEEGPQQGQGMPALPCTGSCIFQRTLEGHLGSIRALVQVGKAWDKRRPVTAPAEGIAVSTITRGPELGYLQGRSRLPMETQSNLTFLPNDFLHLTLHLIFEPGSLPCESQPGIINNAHSATGSVTCPRPHNLSTWGSDFQVLGLEPFTIVVVII